MYSLRVLLLLLPFFSAQTDHDALWEAGRRMEALEAMKQAAAASPGDMGIRRSLVQRCMAVHHYTAALEWMEGLGEEVAAQRALAYYFLGDYERAAKLLDARDAEQSLLLVDSLVALGRLEDASKALDAAAGVLGAENPRILTLRGQRDAREGRHSDAVRSFRRALEVDSLQMDALYGLGRSLLQEGAREEALAVLERHRRLVPLVDQLQFAQQSLDLEPLSAHNHALVGDVERQLGRIERAEAAYSRASELASPEELPPIALRRARCLAEDRGDVDGAVSALMRAFDRCMDPRLPVRAGDLLAEAGRANEALASYQRALALRPTDEAILKRIAALRLDEKRRP